ESELGNLLSGETTFLKVIKDYVAAKREDEWDSTDLVDYFFYNVDPYPYDKQATATDGFFWNLLILGVISYPSIDNGWDRAARWWVKQQRFVELTARGKALLRKLHAMHATSTN